PFKSRARIGLHRKRSGRCAPGNSIHVGAAESGRASTNISGEVLRREFERRQWRILTDLPRHDLINGGIGENVFRFRSLRPYSSEESRGADGMITHLAPRMGAREIGYYDEFVVEGLQRRQYWSECEVFADRRRSELLHDGAVREVDNSKTHR